MARSSFMTTRLDHIQKFGDTQTDIFEEEEKESFLTVKGYKKSVTCENIQKIYIHIYIYIKSNNDPV